jgi:PncC family amidohydrolase
MVKLYPMDQEALEVTKNVHQAVRDRGLTLSVAESCTGGLVSHYITALPGASTFFLAGIVSYSAETKKDILGIVPETISNHGVVSDETAREMAVRVRLLTKTDCSVSTTGNLGPEVMEGKEKGLVYIAASKEGMTISKELKLPGGRNDNKEKAALEALKLLVELLEKE